MNQSEHQRQQLKLAHDAVAGDISARESVNELIKPLIEFHTDKFCKRFCRENKHHYRCSLTKPFPYSSSQALLCEWGNASYGWMLDDLGSGKRLQKYQGRNGASLFDYLYRIANSLPFYERWKDWRFGRRIHVPTYIQELSPHAAKIFYALRSHNDLVFISQQTGLALTEVNKTTQLIIKTLTRRNRLHLLNPPVTQSLTSGVEEDQVGTADQMDIPWLDESIENQLEKEHVNYAWKKLDVIEQFVLESLVIDDQDASSVLYALKKMDITIKKGVSAEHTSVQQLYYFKRKALTTLAKILRETEA